MLPRSSPRKWTIVSCKCMGTNPLSPQRRNDSSERTQINAKSNNGGWALRFYPSPAPPYTDGDDQSRASGGRSYKLSDASSYSSDTPSSLYLAERFFAVDSG